MTKVFKWFRLAAVRNNSVMKYLLYAVGEIVLITVGILIALQINNRNERHKNEAKVAKMLTQIQRDLLADIEMADQIIAVYGRKDSLMNLVLNDEVSAEDYQNNPGFFTLVTTVFTFQLKDENYKNLMRSSDIIDTRYDTLISNLDDIYLTNKAGIDEVNEALSSFTTSLLEKWANSFPWYYTFFQGELDDGAIDYFVNDPFYKNAVATYQTYSSENLLTMAKNHKIRAVLVYREIAKALHQPGPYPQIIESLMVDIEPATQQKMVGVYRVAPHFAIEITRQGNQLYAQATNQNKFALYAKSDSVLFAAVAEIKLVFKKNAETDEFLGFDVVQNGNKTFFPKEK